MKNVFAIALIVFVLTACSPQPTTTAIPTNPPPPADTQIPPATETAVPLPTETAVPTATLEPSPTPDPIIFRDEFDGSLDQWWIWTNENPKKWSLSNNPGYLEIGPEGGRISDGKIKNLLLREAPVGNFQLDTKMTFTPTGNFQIAGLIIYVDNQNQIQFGKAYCDMGSCVGAGAYFDMVNNGTFVDSNYATVLPNSDILYLRLTKIDNIYTAFYSIDGVEYKEIGSHKSSLQPVSVGLITGQAYGSLPKPAQYDYFTITSLP
jgi:beta-xylosidase